MKLQTDSMPFKLSPIWLFFSPYFKSQIHAKYTVKQNSSAMVLSTTSLLDTNVVSDTYTFSEPKEEKENVKLMYSSSGSF